MAGRKRPRSGDSFGFLAEFENEKGLLAAIHACRDEGYRQMEAYTPLPVHAVWEALGHKSHLPKLVLAGGITGGIVGFGMQYFASVIHYPLNVGGRPLNSWPSFIIITFEMTILFAALTAVFGMLALNGLPRPHHPVFDVPAFETASRDKFFLLIPWYDPIYASEHARAFFEKHHPASLNEVFHP
jgi:hypothetical protein